MTTSDIVYVSRDGGGAITGVFKNRQFGLADEAVSSDDTQVAAFVGKDSISSFKARDFFSQLTTQDYALIKVAIAASDTMALLWSSLQAQGDAPIFVTSPRFQAGWAGIVSVLGSERAAQLAQALKLTL